MDRESLEKLIMDFKYWESCKAYTNLIKKFIDKNISKIEFYDRFFHMWKSDCNKTYNLKKLMYITKNFKSTKIDGFSSLISDLFVEFEADRLLGKDYEISEKELIDFVKKILLEINYRYF